MKHKIKTQISYKAVNKKLSLADSLWCYLYCEGYKLGLGEIISLGPGYRGREFYKAKKDPYF